MRLQRPIRGQPFRTCEGKSPSCTSCPIYCPKNALLTFLCICSHTPPEYKDTWPPLPWFLRKVAIPYVLARKHAGYVHLVPLKYLFYMLASPCTYCFQIYFQVLEVLSLCIVVNYWCAPTHDDTDTYHFDTA